MMHPLSDMTRFQDTALFSTKTSKIHKNRKNRKKIENTTISPQNLRIQGEMRIIALPSPPHPTLSPGIHCIYGDHFQNTCGLYSVEVQLSLFSQLVYSTTGIIQNAYFYLGKRRARWYSWKCSVWLYL